MTSRNPLLKESALQSFRTRGVEKRTEGEKWHLDLEGVGSARPVKVPSLTRCLGTRNLCSMNTYISIHFTF